jgi:hypothetical protein
MAGSQSIRARHAGEIVGLTALFLALSLAARGEDPTEPSPVPPRAASIVAAVEPAPAPASEPVPGPPSFPAPSYVEVGGGGGAPTVPLPAPPVQMSLLDTIAYSLFGDVYAEGSWRPLPLETFFSEGWLEPWAAAPAGRDGLTPRHGWLDAFDAVFYRLWFTTFVYSNNINAPFGGNRYAGHYSIFLPLSRRFEIFFDVPFVVSNGTINPTRGYTSRFGDLQVVPRFMLSETAATSQAFALVVQTPTGSTGNGNGVMALWPRYEFWTNPGGPWVVRGSDGFYVPMNKAQAPAAHTAFLGGLAVGRYFRPHNVVFGDLVFYAACDYTVPLDGTASSNTVVTVGPGTRFHIANNYFFLADWNFPVTGNRPDTYTFQVALLKVF